MVALANTILLLRWYLDRDPYATDRIVLDTESMLTSIKLFQSRSGIRKSDTVMLLLTILSRNGYR